jgi:coproporphyrinogen III oxidase-like Fe-S oxidoreductase
MVSQIKSTEIAKIKSDLEHLYKTVYQGNGKPSILNQITSIEHRLTSLEDKLDTSFKTMETEMALKFDNITEVVNERFNHISYQISTEFDRSKMKEVGRHQLKAGLVTAVIAAITTLIAIAINYALRVH